MNLALWCFRGSPSLRSFALYPTIPKIIESFVRVRDEHYAWAVGYAGEGSRVDGFAVLACLRNSCEVE